MTEAALQRVVTDLAHLLGYAVYHTYDSRHSEPGFPDLVLCDGHRTFFRELKGDGGRVSDAQRAWITRLLLAGQDIEIWTPTDWRNGTIERELKGEAP